MRWDFVYQLISLHPELMKHCSLSGIDLSDKQDPSQATELFSLYKYFIRAGYHAMGMFLKCAHYIAEAFLDKSLDPYSRLYRVWFAKTFFTSWYHSVSENHHFLSHATFKDVVCAIDGLLLYMVVLLTEFPDAPIAPWLLGSDSNEQLFAWIRVSMYLGRRINIDIIRMMSGMEKRNVFSNETEEEDLTAYAHSRGRTVLKKAVSLPGESAERAKEKAKRFYGKDLEIKEIKKALEKGTKECLDECRKLGLNLALQFDQTWRGELVEDDDDSDIDDVVEGDGAVSHEVTNETEEDEDSPTIIKMPLGDMHIATAESIYLNGGKVTLSGQSRKSRFFSNTFNKKDGFYEFMKKSDVCCEHAVKPGQKLKLRTFKDKKLKVFGKVEYISNNFNPLKYDCPNHNLPDGNVNIWLWCEKSNEGGKYIRCIFGKK